MNNEELIYVLEENYYFNQLDDSVENKVTLTSRSSLSNDGVVSFLSKNEGSTIKEDLENNIKAKLAKKIEVIIKKSYNLESDVKINPQTANWEKILNHFGDGSSLDDYILDALKSLSDSNWSNMLVIVVNFEIEDLVLYASVKAEVKSANYSIIKHLNSGISLTEGTSLEKAILYSMNELGLVRLLKK